MEYPFSLVVGAKEASDLLAGAYSFAFTEVQKCIVYGCSTIDLRKYDEKIRREMENAFFLTTKDNQVYEIPQFDLDDTEKELLYIDVLIFEAVSEGKDEIERNVDEVVAEYLEELGYTVREGFISWWGVSV